VKFGHTLGLDHYPDSTSTDSCMKDPNGVGFTNHDEDHIDGLYNNNPNG